MKMRVPSIPLITVDPYFSVWSPNGLTKCVPTHWTGSPNTMLGIVTVDGQAWRFLGKSQVPELPQTSLDVDAFSTEAVFENDQIRLTVKFTSPMLVEELYYASRPVSYCKVRWEARDGAAHTVQVKFVAGEELVLNLKGEGRAWSRDFTAGNVHGVRMGSGKQDVLWRSGDNVRIDWGYFYMGTTAESVTGNEVLDGDQYAVYTEATVPEEALFLFAYDDIDSLIYFNRPVKAYWKKDGKTIEEAIEEAAGEYDALLEKCEAFSRRLCEEATKKGGEQYAELLLLATRQVMAAHKLAVDENGELLYISKECFSNGCAATVDVTYPSAPMFLLYNPELLKGMLRPVFRYAATDEWTFDFAPHDVGRYPHVNGQVYGQNRIERQMPVEECGNMIILMAALCDAQDNADYAKEHLEVLRQWSRYLIRYGADPESQLCTDDFAGHLSHNCNLTLKAIMGVAGFSRILQRLGFAEEAEEMMAEAHRLADSFMERAQNPDGSTRLAFDREGTFSLKYNAVWDKLWGTKLLPDSFFKNELLRYRKEMMYYGVPLDNRERYTKSDWLVWAACLSDNRTDFEYLIDSLWRAYDTMRTRVPMSDWYFCDTSEMRGFRHRTVQGGLFLKLMFD